MSRFFASLSLAMVLFAALDLSLPASAQNSLPFTGTTSISRIDVSALPNIQFHGEGQMSQMGAFSFYQTCSVQTDDALASFTRNVIVGGSFALIENDGGSLYGSTAGSILYLPSGEAVIYGTYFIKGGTGRFEGAGGAFVAQGLQHSDLSVSVVVYGDLTLPKSCRHRKHGSSNSWKHDESRRNH